MDRRRIETLEQAKASQRDAARPDAVAQVHAGAKLTARERIEALLDPDSAVEYGAIAAVDREGGWVAEAGGVDFVGTVNGHTVIASSTDYTDRGGGYGAARLERLMALAHEYRWPMVLFVDGGGSRARHPRTGLGHTEITGPMGRFQLFDGMAELSGWAPSVAIVSGPSFAGHASLAGFSDCVISIPGSSIGMGGPPMVEAAFGISLSASELAGAEMHDRSGGIDLLVGDEEAAIAAAQRYISYLFDEENGGSPATGPSLASLVPDTGPYDMRPVIAGLVDSGSFFELRASFAGSVLTGFARLEGRAIGMMASQPVVRGGRIDEGAATKVARFVEICDSYDLPMLALIDSEGCDTTWRTSHTVSSEEEAVTPGVCRWHSRPIIAHQHRDTPLVSVQIRHARDLSMQILAGPPNARQVPLLHLAWPCAEIGNVDGYTSTRNVNTFDDVIDPDQTRRRICTMLAHIPARAERRARQSTKKRPIDTW